MHLIDYGYLNVPAIFAKELCKLTRGLESTHNDCHNSFDNDKLKHDFVELSCSDDDAQIVIDYLKLCNVPYIYNHDVTEDFTEVRYFNINEHSKEDEITFNTLDLMVDPSLTGRLTKQKKEVMAVRKNAKLDPKHVNYVLDKLVTLYKLTQNMNTLEGYNPYANHSNEPSGQGS